MASGIPKTNRHQHPFGWLTRWLAITIAAALSAPACHASATADISAICETAATDAARRTGVPATVLTAISLTETGRKNDSGFRPWPWTVNMEGKGFWFDTEDDARAFVYKEYKRGARSFDVGCFQINYKWHGEAFASIEQMFDPTANAVYAAQFLASLYGESGSWSVAAGAYHSRDPAFADGYRKRFDRIHDRVAAEGPSGTADVDAPGGETPIYAAGRRDIPEIPDIVLAANGGAYDEPAAPRQPRVNTFPLFQTGASAGMGSLVPVLEAQGASLFDTSVAVGPVPGPAPGPTE